MEQEKEKNPVSFIHEYCQARKTEVLFKVTDQEGEPHARRFTVSCTVLDFVTTGTGRSIKQGRIESAENMIMKLRNEKLINPELLKDKGKKNTLGSLRGNSLMTKIEDNPIGCLQEYCMAEKIPAPEYDDTKTDRGFKTVCKVNDIICEGFGRQKKLSKSEAAKKMCEIIFEKQLNDESEIQVNGIDKKTEESIETNDEESRDSAS